jgi:hypothetical protein
MDLFGGERHVSLRILLFRLGMLTSTGNGALTTGQLLTTEFVEENPKQATPRLTSTLKRKSNCSQSHLICSPCDPVAKFCGNLDIRTLGGAGFASQRTTSDSLWDLSDYDGIKISVKKFDSEVLQC